jgi:long-chain acyl-CoA synthetase
METRTLNELFYRSVDTYKKAAHLRVKRDGAWRDISSEEFRRSVEEISMGLRALGIEKGDVVAILSENRPEWAYADLATLCAAAVNAPIYSTLTPAQILYILNDSHAKAVFVSNDTQAQKVAEVRSQVKHLQHVIRMDPPPQDTLSLHEVKAKLSGYPKPATPDTLSLDELRAKGRPALEKDPQAVRKRAAEVKAEHLATLIYTSGTTGDPKGVMLLHSNLVSNVVGSLQAFSGIGPSDTALSFLPLCHVFERMGGHYLMLQVGATIAYAEGIDKVPQNMLEVQPTMMLSVPRLYEKMYARIQEKVASDPEKRQKIFRWALSVGRAKFRHQCDGTSPGLWLSVRHKLADTLVFSKIRERTGGKLRLFVSGGAPLAREIAEFFGAAGLMILEGYGLTETSPVISVNTPNAMRPGSVGRPIPGVEVKIAEDGEILTRGPHVMKGYFGKPEATAEAIDQDGWFHTGDVGVIDKDGFLIITDRKKDILVTSGGKNIAPQPIENKIKANKFFAEVVMIGNKRAFPAALIVPNFEVLDKWAKQGGIAFASHQELVGKPEVVAHYRALVTDLTSDLAQFERIKKLALLTSEFTLEAGELTPTLKVKRRVVEQKYKEQIDALYGSGAMD